ncbi:MAG: hypothetical protein QF628_07450 [Acidimicrobiales bacterium]|nr:hypothetical protein [Acidimicrobiales bacterium]MDP6281567.1 hypothetical protein [Acidimicrobiales bacterium]MDP7118095.1 hypothetical protein [Acidimicrobiales bacterium]MEE1521222.1 hypothetical protein [Acidimicrobiales bacterium]MEE1570206.1 hypothetical protein [Acidimicrobiales bacterium]
MPEGRNKAGPCKQRDRPVFCQVNHNGFSRLSAAQIGDHAVRARIGRKQAACVAVDQQRWFGWVGV